MSTMDVPGEALPRHLDGPRSPGWWGMLGLVVTEAMLFASLFMAYFYLWGSVEALGEEAGTYPELRLPLLMTVLLVSSSVFMYVAEKGIKRGDQRRLRVGLGVAWLLSAAFLVVQYVEYSRKQVGPDVSPYHAIFYTITAVHGAHVCVAVLMGAFLQVRAWLGHFTEHDHLAVENVGLYWHFVDTVWLFILGILYLSPYFWHH